jgi:membrane protein implicated in regulation of membrane protease activity
MPVAYIVVIALVAVATLYIAARTLFPAWEQESPASESFLLEEAVVVEPVAPGMEGRAEIRKRGAKPVLFRVRAMEDSLAFARGARVRVIDLREGICIVEGADAVHLVR